MADMDAGIIQPATTGSEPLTRNGMLSEEAAYLQGGAKLAAPSIINTSSKYLNNPYYRDTYAQIALRRSGDDVPPTYTIPMVAKAIGEVTDFTEFAGLIEAEKALKPQFAEWLAARRHTTYRPEDMVGYKPGTLGHAIGRFLAESGYEMNKMQLSTTKIVNDIDYISQRRGSIHDLEHMVTGFGPNYCGETALIWANITSIAHYFSPPLAQHISAGITFLASASMQQKSLHCPEILPEALKAIRMGIAMGEKLKRPLLLEPWEDMFDWQISDIQHHLGIEPGPGATWDWTSTYNRD